MCLKHSPQPQLLGLQSSVSVAICIFQDIYHLLTYIYKHPCWQYRQYFNNPYIWCSFKIQVLISISKMVVLQDLIPDVIVFWRSRTGCDRCCRWGLARARMSAAHQSRNIFHASDFKPNTGGPVCAERERVVWLGGQKEHSRHVVSRQLHQYKPWVSEELTENTSLILDNPESV